LPTAPEDIKFDYATGDYFGGKEVFIKTTLTTTPTLASTWIDRWYVDEWLT